MSHPFTAEYQRLDGFDRIVGHYEIVRGWELTQVRDPYTTEPICGIVSSGMSLLGNRRVVKAGLYLVPVDALFHMEVRVDFTPTLTDDEVRQLTDLTTENAVRDVVRNFPCLRTDRYAIVEAREEQREAP